MYLQSKCSTVEMNHNVNIQTDSWHNDPASMMSLCLMTLGIAGQLTRMVTWGWRYRQLNGMDRGEIYAQRLTYVDQADHIIAWPNGWHPSPGPGSTGWFSSNPATIDKMNPPTTHTHTLPPFPPTHPPTLSGLPTLSPSLPPASPWQPGSRDTHPTNQLYGLFGQGLGQFPFTTSPLSALIKGGRFYTGRAAQPPQALGLLP